MSDEERLHDLVKLKIELWRLRDRALADAVDLAEARARGDELLMRCQEVAADLRDTRLSDAAEVHLIAARNARWAIELHVPGRHTQPRPARRRRSW